MTRRAPFMTPEAWSQLAALMRWYAPCRGLDVVRKPARRYPVPTGGFRIGTP